jgi:DNA repair exonuclease SbcCD ATPase subunit
VADQVDDVAGRLYGLPLEDFTRERDAAARELRKAKDRDAADAVAKLPKPSQGAWAANTLAREHRDLVDALLDAGDELRAAQEDAVAGKGASALRDAAAVEREAVEALVDVAKELKPAGRKPSAQTLERLRTTLHAAATDDDVRTALDQGRLVEDATGAGAWGLVAGADAPAVAPRRERKKAAPRKKADDREAAARERKEREERLAAERERRSQLEAELREARAERRSRERELERAEKAAERAAKRLEDALAAAEDAREQADEARADLDTAREAAQEARDEAAKLEEQLD